MPDFMAMANELKRDLQSDAEIMGMEFIHSNFEQQGFTDVAFEPWEPRKTSTSYNLLRVTNYLFNSINVANSSEERIVFQADAPYADIHNNGGILNIPITRKSRKLFWAMYYSTGQEKWKWMALTKKQSFTFKMDARPFMKHSESFAKDWNTHVKNEIIKRFKQL